MNVIDLIEVSPGKWAKKTPKTMMQANLRKGIDKIKETFNRFKTGGKTSPKVSTVDRIKKFFNNIKGKANSGSQSTQATFSINGKNFVTDTNGKNSTILDRMKSHLNYLKEKIKTGGKTSSRFSTTGKIKDFFKNFTSKFTKGAKATNQTTSLAITGGKQTVKTTLKRRLMNSKLITRLKGSKLVSLACAHPVVAITVAIGSVAYGICKNKVDKQIQAFKADAAQNDDNISRLKADIQFLSRLKVNADGDNQ